MQKQEVTVCETAGSEKVLDIRRENEKDNHASLGFLFSLHLIGHVIHFIEPVPHMLHVPHLVLNWPEFRREQWEWVRWLSWDGDVVGYRSEV